MSHLVVDRSGGLMTFSGMLAARTVGKPEPKSAAARQRELEAKLLLADKSND